MTRPYQTDGDVERRPIFTLRLAGKPGMAGIQELRALLKRLLRSHGFRALDVREEREYDDEQQEDSWQTG